MKKLLVYCVLLITAISCSAPDAKEQQRSALDVVAPEEAGMIADSLDLIEEHLRWAIDSQYVAGGVALVYRNGQIVYQKAFGFQTAKKPIPSQPTTSFG